MAVYNRTGQEIIIQTKPELPIFRHTSFPGTSQVLVNTREYKISDDSSLTLLATFGPLLFNTKIKEVDLATDYLKIMTSKDTILAIDRAEIIKLTKSERTKYKKRLTKDLLLTTTKILKQSSSDNKANAQQVVWQYGGATSIFSTFCSLIGFSSGRRIKPGNGINNKLLFINVASVTG